jgi:hypothetical protein
MTDWPDAPNPVESPDLDASPVAWTAWDRCGLALARIYRQGDPDKLQRALDALLAISPESEGTTDREKKWLQRDREAMAVG